ncbi:MAG: hypothetical protein NZ602_11605 [Thermoguttaceae bacterium]|nr:hypothetical protein [Thermoguttaceae bacterium]MDW8039313.1 hypothetical protein [Thermoguttaceae bacterium]
MKKKWISLLLGFFFLAIGMLGCGGSTVSPAKVTPEEEKQIQKQLQEAAAAEGRAGWGKQLPESSPTPKK